MISAWPTDDTLPAEGFDAVRQTYKKLSHGLHEIADVAAGEEKWVTFFHSQLRQVVQTTTEPSMMPLSV